MKDSLLREQLLNFKSELFIAMKRTAPSGANNPIKYFRWKSTGWEDKLVQIYKEFKGDLDLIVSKCEGEGLTVGRDKIRKKLNDLMKAGKLEATPAWNARRAQVPTFL